MLNQWRTQGLPEVGGGQPERWECQYIVLVIFPKNSMKLKKKIDPEGVVSLTPRLEAVNVKVAQKTHAQ